MEQELVIINNKTPLADSREIANQLGVDHESFFKMVKKYQSEIEQDFGSLRFQIGVKSGNRGGDQPRYVLLNENQTYTLMMYTQNTEQARACKRLLVKAFSEARERIQRLEQVIALHDAHHPHAISTDAFADFSRYLSLLYKSIQAQKKLPGANKAQLTQSLKYVQECITYVEAHENAVIDFDGKLLELYSAEGDKPTS